MKHTRALSTRFTRTLAVLGAAILCLTGLASIQARTVGSGHVVTEMRKVSGFRGLEFDLDADITVVQGGLEGLVMEGDDNILPLIKTAVNSEGILVIKFKESARNVEPGRSLNFRLAAKTLEKVHIVGAGKFHAASLSVVHPRMWVLGSGKIQVDHLKADVFAVEVDGTGEVTIDGETRQELAVIDGAGTLSTKNLKAMETVIEINGTGEARVWAVTSLEADINGSGEVSYYGSPALKKNIGGGGRVKALGAKNG